MVLSVSVADHPQPLMNSSQNDAAHPKPSQHVMLFTKYPTPGYAKTRLASTVGADHAAQISRLLSERIVQTIRRFIATNPQPIISTIHYTTITSTDTDLDLMRAWLGTPAAPYENCEQLIRQTSGDLGERLRAAFEHSFGQGVEKVVVVGADIPEISCAILGEAFEQLDGADVVIGPAEDGGYYLLGMRELHAQLFQGVEWSTDSVFESTVRIAESVGLSVAKLRRLRDIDVPADLAYLDKVLNQCPEEVLPSTL